MQNPKDLVTVLQKTQTGINFFTANYDYQKAELYRQRFEFLRDVALGKLNLMVLKILRDCNADNNMRVIQANVFEKERKAQDCDAFHGDIEQLIFTKPR